MCVCMCVFLYIYIYIHTYTHTNISIIYIYIYIYIYIPGLLPSCHGFGIELPHVLFFVCQLDASVFIIVYSAC